MNSQETNIFSLSKQDTLVMKGIAICAMLCHHMYAFPPDGVEPYTGVLHWLGVLGKVCVGLFLFCSGYGLAANYKPTSIKEDLKFIGHRLVKFYLNYWVIFLIFVPITVFAFHRPLSDAYGEHVNIVKRLIFDICGIQGINSYNITWWFNQLIILLYILFPFLYRTIRYKPWLFLIFSMVLTQMAPYIPYMPYNPANICTWQLPFVLGIIWKFYETRWSVAQECIEKHKSIAIICSLCVLCVIIVLRMYPIIPYWGEIQMDGFLSCAVAMCVITILRNLKYITSTFTFLGKHSMNIYLMHTFINGYWHPEWLHYSEWLRGGEFRHSSVNMHCGKRSARIY